MPQALRKFGRDRQRVKLAREKEMIKETKMRLYEIGDLLVPQVGLYIDLLYEDIPGQINLDLWRHQQKNWLSILGTKIRNQYDLLARLAQKYQKQAFIGGYTAIRNNTQKLYSTKATVSDEPVKIPKFLGNRLKVNVTKRQLTLRGQEAQYTVSVELESDQKAISRFLESQQEQAEQWFQEQASGTIEFAIGTGKPNAEFMRFLNAQFEQGLDPTTQIKTLAHNHVQFVQQQMTSAIAKGKDLVWAKEKIMKELGKNLTSKKALQEMEFNVMRVMRTAHQRASTTATSMFAERNKHIIVALERIANGRPCLACIVLDGKRYPPGTMMDDHPMGMCDFIYVYKTPDELGKKVSGAAKNLWLINMCSYQPWQSKFRGMTPDQQRRAMANNKLFELWQQERFPLEKMVVKRNGSFVPVTHQGAAANYHNWGGVNHPLVRFGEEVSTWSQTQQTQFMHWIDSKDRARKGWVVFPQEALPERLKDSPAFAKMGEDYLKRVAPRAQEEAEFFIDFYGKNKNWKWYDENEYYRILGHYRRVMPNGSVYYAMPEGEYKRLVVR